MPLDLFAGIGVRDYEVAREWYERLFGAEPAFLASDTEAVWELAEHRYVYVEQDARRAGHAVLTFFVDDLDAVVAGSRSVGSSRPGARSTRAACRRSCSATPTATRWASAARGDANPRDRCAGGRRLARSIAVATVGFLHVAGAHVQAASRFVAEHAPHVTDVHLVDERLLEPTEDLLLRLAARIGELVGRDVDAVVCTCPALLADVARIARRAGVAACDLPELARRVTPALTSGGS